MFSLGKHFLKLCLIFDSLNLEDTLLKVKPFNLWQRGEFFGTFHFALPWIVSKLHNWHIWLKQPFLIPNLREKVFYLNPTRNTPFDLPWSGESAKLFLDFFDFQKKYFVAYRFIFNFFILGKSIFFWFFIDCHTYPYHSVPSAEGAR